MTTEPSSAIAMVTLTIKPNIMVKPQKLPQLATNMGIERFFF
jgi:hypothetical protein